MTGKLTELLKEELVIAMGCTEPLALAYAGSLARHHLKEKPKRVILECSTNIFKNVRCVSLPLKSDLKGVKASCLLGVFGGNHEKGFACVDHVDKKYDDEIKQFIEAGLIEVNYIQSPEKLYINLTLIAKDTVSVEIQKRHLNVTKITKNEKIIYQNNTEKEEKRDLSEILKFKNIYEFAKNVDLSQLEAIIKMQYDYNYAISKKGLTDAKGVEIGKIILANDSTVWGKVKAYTASGCEARMCGSLLPVVINSGSGNQGLSSSVPIIVYGKEKQLPKTKIYRALIFSNLLTIKQKVGIGSLSAYCGIVASSGSAGAALTYLSGGTYQQIVMSMKNYLANVPGIICDGAKASCAAKLATSLDGAILGHLLAMNNKQYQDDSGIIKQDIDETIDIVIEIANLGMKKTDETIIKNIIK